MTRTAQVLTALKGRATHEQDQMRTVVLGDDNIMDGIEAVISPSRERFVDRITEGSSWEK